MSINTTLHLPIAKPPFSKLGKKIESQVRKALHEWSMIEATSIGVALSGGKDSLTLLYMLKAISSRGFPELKITAFFVDGEMSCGAGIDSSFLISICKSLNIPLVILQSEYHPDKPNCYSCSRDRRKRIFDAALERSIKTVAFGHHQDDCVETFCLNMLHKAEFEGNLAKVKMIKYGVTIIRPLIYCSEQDIVNFAKLHGFFRITCQCPIGARSKRKAVKNIIQSIEKEFPHAKVNMAKIMHRYGTSKASLGDKLP